MTPPTRRDFLAASAALPLAPPPRPAGPLPFEPVRIPARVADTIGAGHTLFASVGGPAFVCDLDRGRRPGSQAEVCDFLRLVQSLEILHQEGGGPFEAMDLPQESRHLDLYYAQIALTDKNWQPWGLGRERARDALEMAAIAFGVGREALASTPVFT